MLDAPHPRVVSLAPALTAIVQAVGAAPHLVGVTSFCDVPGVPVVGDFNPRPEAVMAQTPDVVLMAGYESQSSVAASLSALGLNVQTLPLVTLADMRATTQKVGVIVGREAAASEALRAFDGALQAVAALAKRPKVLLVYDVQPGFVITTGGGDHLSELVAACGGVNAISGPLTARIGLERVLEAAPDLILHVAPDQRFADSAAALRHWSTWRTVPAVARANVVVYPDDGFARNGPHLATVVPRLAAFIAAAL